MYELYSLIDPRNNTIAYIGYTKRPKNRLSEHISVSKNLKRSESNSYKSKWIRKLEKVNEKPIYKTLLRTNSEIEIKNLEIDYIKYYKQFYKLKNNTLGGDGTSGRLLSNAEKENLRIKNKGLIKIEQRFNVEILHSKTSEYYIFKDKTEAAKFIGCKENAIMSVSCGHRKTVYKWYVKLVNRKRGTLLL